MTSSDDNPYQAPRASPEPGPPRPFLTTAISATLLIAIGLAIAWGLPGLGIPFLLLVVPTQVRASLWIARRRATGQPLSGAAEFAEYLTSAGVTILTLLVSGIAFVGTCLPLSCMTVNLGGPGHETTPPFSEYVPWAVGGGAALLVLLTLGPRLWRHKADPQESTPPLGTDRPGDVPPETSKEPDP